MLTFPTRPLRAPSAALLRFLKSQSACEACVCPRLASSGGGSARQIRSASTGRRSTFHASAQSTSANQYNGMFSGHIWRLPTSSSPASTLQTYIRPRRTDLLTRASTACSPTQRRFAGLWDWHFKDKKAKAPLHPHDLPPLASFLDDHASFGRIPKPSHELILKCTELDENGKVTLMDGEFKKTELIAKYGLLPRDLRKIDSSLLPHVLIRPSAILINLLHLRVLIQHNRVLIFEPYGSTDSYTQSSFIYDLEGRLRQAPSTHQSLQNLPYEFRALEAVLISVTAGLESEFEGVRGPVVRVLRALEEDIDREKLRYLLVWAKKLGTFEQKARLVRDALEELLEADDDLASMYLTEKATKTERSEDDHAEVEMLLESYHRVTDEIVQAAENLVSNIRNTEEIVKAILDANRNALMLLDLKFSIGTLGLSAGTFIAALYGMNLKNFIEESDLGFWGVSAACGVISVIVLLGSLRKLSTVQRLSMWGEGGARGGRGNWNQLADNFSVPRDGAVGSALGPGAGAAGLGPLSRWEATRARRQQGNPPFRGHGNGSAKDRRGFER